MDENNKGKEDPEASAVILSFGALSEERLIELQYRLCITTGAIGTSSPTTCYIADPNRCTPYDVLTCLQKSDPGTLEEFVTEYGYEIKGFKSFNRARRIHAACTRAWKNVKRLCETEEELEALWEIC